MNRVILILLFVVAASCAGKKLQGDNTSVSFRQAADITGHSWELAEIQGIVLTESNRNKAYFEPDTVAKRIYGNAGCNNFNGRLQLSGDGGMTVSEVASTKMACEDMSLEYALMEVLKKTAGYKQENDTLVFIDSEGVGLARFVRGVDSD